MAKGRRAARKTAPAKRSPREQARLVAEATTAMRELIARVPRRHGYDAEPALIFDPLQGRRPAKAAR